MNLNPQVADTHFALAYSSEGTTLKLSYVKWRSDVTYFVEVSSDLLTWTQAGVTETENGGTVTASVPIISNHRFLRLRIAYP